MHNRVVQLDSVIAEEEILSSFSADFFKSLTEWNPATAPAAVEKWIRVFPRLLLEISALLCLHNTLGSSLLLLKTSKESVMRLIRYGLVRLLINSGIYGRNRFPRLWSMLYLLDFLNFSRFLKSGKYPSLAYFLGGLELESEQSPRPIFNVIKRQLAWNSLISIFQLMSTIPSITQSWSFGRRKKMPAHSLPNPSDCSFCNAQELPKIYQSKTCQHWACYVCKSLVQSSCCSFT